METTLNLDDVVQFCYSRNKAWGIVPIEKIKDFLETIAERVIVIFYDGKIIGVGIYTIKDDTAIFYSLTIDKHQDGFKLIREYLRNCKLAKKIRWVNKDMELSQCLNS